MKKLDCILLVEDDDTINFYNQFLISELGIASKVVVTRNGEEALEYLRKTDDGSAPTPDLILLDINMPVMNGFEFVEEYEKLPEERQSKMLVVMLTTSLHPEDVARAQQHPSIKEYFYKPLLKERLTEIVSRYF